MGATGSTLTVLASDAPSAYGLRPDWIAVDELAEWRRRELWDSLWSATGKRPRCRMLVIVSEKVAMTLTRHQTRAVFDRYDIVNEADLRRAVEKLAARRPTGRARAGHAAEDRS